MGEREELVPITNPAQLQVGMLVEYHGTGRLKTIRGKHRWILVGRGTRDCPHHDIRCWDIGGPKDMCGACCIRLGRLYRVETRRDDEDEQEALVLRDQVMARGVTRQIRERLR